MVSGNVLASAHGDVGYLQPTRFVTFELRHHLAHVCYINFILSMSLSKINKLILVVKIGRGHFTNSVFSAATFPGNARQPPSRRRGTRNICKCCFLVSFQKHRVLIPEEEVKKRIVRRSLAFFVHPDNDVIVECLDGSNKYPPVTGMGYLQQRFAATY